jgi:hypothetical protein
MAGPFGPLGQSLSSRDFWVVFLVMCAAYVVVVLCSATIRARWAIGAVVALHVLFWLSPPLLSRDVFNYIEYGRIFWVHGLDPYTHGAGAVVSDAAYPYICCHRSPDVYGPGFTLLTAALSPLGVPVAFWALKTLTAAAALGGVGLVWRAARLLDRPPLPAALLVGCNPVVLAFAVGGAHNDSLMMFIVLAGVSVWLAGRESGGVVLAVGSMAVKISGAVIAPFMIVGSSRKIRSLGTAVLTGAALVLLLVAAFGVDAVSGLLGAIEDQQDASSLGAFPHELGLVLGLGPHPHGLKTALVIGFAALVAWLLLRVWRGADWVSCAGWATLGLLMTTSWLFPWYIVWLLPLAALGEGRALRLAALVATAYVVWARTSLFY